MPRYNKQLSGAGMAINSARMEIFQPASIDVPETIALVDAMAGIIRFTTP